MKRRALRGRRLALVIAPGAVTAVELETTWRGPRAGRVAECDVGPPASDGAWPELEAALVDLVRELGIAGCVADVLLARPYAHVKVAALPPLRRRDLRALLQRGARRWFPVPEGAVVAEALPLRAGSLRRRASVGGRWYRRGPSHASAEPAVAAMAARSTAPQRAADAIALVAPDAVVRAATDAVTGARLRVGVVAPVSLAVAALALRRAGRRALARGFALVARGAGWAERIVVRGGVPRLFQPLPSADGAEPCIAVAPLDEGADDAAARSARAAGRDAGQTPRVVHTSGLRRLSALHPAVGAGLGALCLREQPLLLPATLRGAWMRRVRRRAIVRAAAAAALLVLGAAVHLRGLEAELAAVQAARRAVAPTVEEARAAREAVNAVDAMLARVQEAEGAAADWAAVFARIANALPDSAHLVSFRAEEGEVQLGGVAASASAAAAALTAGGILDAVSLAGPVRTADAGGRERFELAARLAHADGPADEARRDEAAPPVRRLDANGGRRSP